MQHTGETTALAAGGTNRGREAVTSSPKGGDDVTEATEEKPRPGPEGENRQQTGGRPLTPKWRTASTEEWLATGERKSQVAALLCGGGGCAKCDENHI